MFYQQPSRNIIELEQGKATAFVTTALKAEYSRIIVAQKVVQKAGGQKNKNINTWNSDRCHSLHNSSFVSFVSLQTFAAYGTDKAHRVQVIYIAG